MTDDIDNPDAWDTDSAEHVTPRPSGMSVFSLRLPSPEFGALRAEAARRAMSMSELTRMALRTYLPSEGWECPKCGACYAPTVRECYHCRPASPMYPVLPIATQAAPSTWAITHESFTLIPGSHNTAPATQDIDS